MDEGEGKGEQKLRDQFILDSYQADDPSRLAYIATVLGLSKAEVEQRWCQLVGRPVRPARPAGKAQPAGGDTMELDEDTEQGLLNLTTLSPRIATPDQAIEYAQIDLEQYAITRVKTNHWEMGCKVPGHGIAVTPLHQITVFLRKRGWDDPEKMRQEWLEVVRTYSPAWPSLPARSFDDDERYMLEIAIMDLHIGKLAWGRETGEDYDSKIAISRFKTAVQDLLWKARHYPIEQIVLPVGNDLIHVDNERSMTFNDTPQDVDSRLRKLVVEARRMLCEAIDQLATVAPVLVPVIPGNHDQTITFTLGDSLDGIYGRCDRVTIDNGPSLRKYVQYGQNLIGFTHGNEEKHAALPGLMTNERPEAIACCPHRRWHIGHTHKRKETWYNLGDTHDGVEVRSIPSITGTDAWHYKKGYVKTPKAAEAFLYHPVRGEEHIFVHRPIVSKVI